jgi:hypothetical protein
MAVLLRDDGVRSYLYKGYLRDNAKELAWRSLAGMPNIILIFGPTRWGKSTLSFCLGKEIATHCKVPFSVDEIEFDAEYLVKEASKGKKHHVYVLDEGAFQLKGEDWQNKASKVLRKFFNVAAKYNQTIIINIPFIGELHKSFIKDEHTCGLRVNARKNSKAKNPNELYERGFVKGYKKSLSTQWHCERNDIHHSLLWKFRPDMPICKFPKDTSFIDEVAYQKKKDAAIQTLNDQDSGSEKTYKNYAGLFAKQLHKVHKYSYLEAGKVAGIHENTIGRIIRASIDPEEIKKDEQE